MTTDAEALAACRAEIAELKAEVERLRHDLGALIRERVGIRRLPRWVRP